MLRKDDRISNTAPRNHPDQFSYRQKQITRRQIQTQKEFLYSAVRIADTKEDAPMDECNLTVSNHSKVYFRHKIYYGQLNFVFTQLRFSPQVNVSIRDSVVDGMVWTWTYFGDEGGFHFLTHPPEVSVWSLGLLQKSVGGLIDPIYLFLETNGCQTNIEIGNASSTRKIGLALKDILSPLYKVNEDYKANFWCYWRRRWISPDWIYTICLHVVCQLQHVEYRCCAHRFSMKNMKRILDCNKRNTFVNDFVWYIPFISGCIFFLNMPLFVLSENQFGDKIFDTINRYHQDS